MEIINLKELYSNYYINHWKKQGLPLITERPPTTTDVLLERFFNSLSNPRKNRRKAIRKNIEATHKRKLDYQDYVRGEYK